MAKTAFPELGRDSVFKADPITQLCIIGGQNEKVRLPESEWGDLDTDDDDSHPLFDENLFEALPEEFIQSIDEKGVIEPVLIGKMIIKNRRGEDVEVAGVIAGRKRIRGARVVNRRRMERNKELPDDQQIALLEVRCVNRKGTLGDYMLDMITENHIRIEDSGETAISKLRRYLDQPGASMAKAAIAFGKSVQTLEGWIAYDEKAVPQLRKLVETGVMTVTSASEIAKQDRDKQLVAVSEVERIQAEAPKPANGAANGGRARPAVSRTAAQTAAKRAASGDAGVEMLSKREGKRLLKHIEGMDHQGASPQTLGFYIGVEAAFGMWLGNAGVDERLKNALKAMRKKEAEREASRAAKTAERDAKKAQGGDAAPKAKRGKKGGGGRKGKK
jgi:hypothetical protein